jgi:hypothetical protein
MRQVRGWLILPAVCIVVAACRSSNHDTATTSTVLPVADVDGI